MSNFPRKLENCPIREAVFEVRFESSFPAGTIYGVAYGALKGSYGESESLPILQIPEAVRDADPNLAHRPYYKMTGDGFVLQIGPKIVVISVVEPYCGWAEFKNEILRVFHALETLGFISEVKRTGLRYINTFKSRILDEIKFEIKINGSVVTNTETLVRTVFEEEEDFKTILQIANEAIITEPDGKTFTGSMIDVDVVKDGIDLPFFSNMEEFVERAHAIEKRRFFELLKDEFLSTFGPVYEEKTC